ncbi:MAG: Abi family protein [Phycisphaerales bacterium]
MTGDPSLMADRLAVVGYYRLTAYWHPFRQSDRTFRPDTEFDTVWKRYVFDRHLRLLVLDATERVEVAVRPPLALNHGLVHGPFAYADDSATLPSLIQRDHQRFRNDLIQQFRNSKEVFVDHFKTNHADSHTYLPVWMATEIMSFGCMLTFYRGSHNDVRRAVSQPFNVHHSVFESWLFALNVVRNICAHHSRLWNRVLGVKPMIPKKKVDWHQPVIVHNDRVFGILTLCKWCLDRVAPQSHWPQRLSQLIDSSPHIPIQDMGFPTNWKDCPIWDQHGEDQR